MLVTYIRSSSYNNYSFCQMQYFLTYVLGHQSDSGKKAEMGTIVHKVMEVFASLKKFQQDNRKRKYLKINDDALGEVKIHTSKFLDHFFVVEIVDRSFDYYTKQSKHKFTAGDRKTCEKLTWTAMEYNEGQFDPRFRNVVASEPHFDILIEEDWAKYDYELPNGEVVSGNLAIKGTIDLVTETENGIIEVVDWKTGRRLDWVTGEEKTYEKLMVDPQLLLYNYAISKTFPEYDQSIMTIFYVKDGGPFSMCFDKSDEEKFLGMLKDTFLSIRDNNSPRLLSPDRSHWKCTKLCHYFKNNWPGTDHNMCTHVEDHLDKHGMDKTVQECTKEGFSIGYYSAPG
jgi:ATP-dependent helicase/DNAse subunit B